VARPCSAVLPKSWLETAPDVIEDAEIILRCLRSRGEWLAYFLDIRSVGEHPVASDRRIELARINAEVARRCWNRVRAHAAMQHSPIGPLP
jgi:hypothetical protein